MKVYSVLIEKNVDCEDEAYILDGVSYTNEGNAWQRMMEFAQFIEDDWNKSDDKFELEIYANVKSCCIQSKDNPDYMYLCVIETEVK